MARKRPAFSTRRRLKSRNTGASPAKRRFANSFRFFLSADSLLPLTCSPNFGEQGLMTLMMEKK